jgi:hypothetical protein
MEDFEKIKSEAETFLNSELNSNITDDKTIAVVINADVLPQIKSGEYYAEPDWERLQSENKRQLYTTGEGDNKC